MASAVQAQWGGPTDPGSGRGAVVVPQQRVYALNSESAGIGVTGVQARVTVLGEIVSVTLQLKIRNTGAFATEASLLLPLPADAVVRDFRFEGQSQGPTARLLPRDEARATYQSIVDRIRDPALLEMAGRTALQSSVFPVEAGGTQAVVVTWDQVLTVRDGRGEFVLGRSELTGAAALPWRIVVELRGADSVGTAWSPTHELRRVRMARDRLLLATLDADVRQPGPFQLTWTTGRPGTLTGTLLAHPREAGGGYVALLAGLPAAAPDASLPREVTLVLDRSGSMRGAKWEQSLEAARQVLAGLRPGEAVNIVDYADDVARFAPAPVRLDDPARTELAHYLDGLLVGGGTNLHGALLAAVSQPAAEGFVPVVLFLTDGLPTVGVQDERRLREEVAEANTAARRLFTFGVGSDVNAPLLDGLAEGSRATPTYVLVGEDVEVAVGRVARRLHGPLVAEPRLEVFDEHGDPAPHALRELQPALLPDQYAEDQLLVLARYTDAAPLRLRLSGRTAYGPWQVEWPFDPADARPENAFVSRLWASRRIATLVDEVRQAAPSGNSASTAAGADARLNELVQEIVQLSTQFGILTEYTSFLATEGSVLTDDAVLKLRVRKALRERSQQTRTGQGAVSQAINIRRMRLAGRTDARNRHVVERGQGLAQVSVGGVRHVHDLTFFATQQGGWVDARLAARVRAGLAQLADQARAASAAPDGTVADALAAGNPDEVVRLGTPEHADLAGRLEAEGRLGVLALDGPVLLMVGNRAVLVLP